MCRRVILDLHEFLLFATPIDSVSIISSLEKMQILDSRTENVMSCLIDALDDPCNPKFCAKFFVDWIHALVDADDRHAEHKPKLRKNTPKMSLHGRISSHGSGHRLLEAIWTFLTTPRTFDDMRALDERMKICRCYGGDLPALAKQIHPPSTSLPSFQSALILLTEFMTNVLSLAPDVYWKSQRRVARAAERGIVVRWPPHALTLLGDEGDTTVTVICRWMAAYPSHKHTYKFFDLLSLAHMWPRRCDHHVPLHVPAAGLRERA